MPPGEVGLASLVQPGEVVCSLQAGHGIYYAPDEGPPGGDHLSSVAQEANDHLQVMFRCGLLAVPFS